MSRARAVRLSCAVAVAAATLALTPGSAIAAEDPQVAASEALGRGDGAAAAQAIRDANASADPRRWPRSSTTAA